MKEAEKQKLESDFKNKKESSQFGCVLGSGPSEQQEWGVLLKQRLKFQCIWHKECFGTYLFGALGLSLGVGASAVCWCCLDAVGIDFESGR